MIKGKLNPQEMWLITVLEKLLKFILNELIYQHALALDVIQVLDVRNYFQSC